MQYIYVPRDVIQSRALSLTDKAVYIALKSFYNNDCNKCFPSHKKIAEKGKVSTSTVRRSIQLLVDQKHVYVSSKQFHSSSYFFPHSSNTIKLDLSLIDKLSPKALSLYAIIVSFTTKEGRCFLTRKEICDVAGINYTNYLYDNLLNELLEANTLIVELHRGKKVFYLPYFNKEEIQIRKTYKGRNRDYVETLNQENKIFL